MLKKNGRYNKHKIEVDVRSGVCTVCLILKFYQILYTVPVTDFLCGSMQNLHLTFYHFEFSTYKVKIVTISEFCPEKVKTWLDL